MRKERSKWSQEQIDDFRQWHITLLEARGYGPKVVEELSRSREKFLLGVKPEYA